MSLFLKKGLFILLIFEIRTGFIYFPMKILSKTKKLCRHFHFHCTFQLNGKEYHYFHCVVLSCRRLKRGLCLCLLRSDSASVQCEGVRVVGGPRVAEGVRAERGGGLAGSYTNIHRPTVHTLQ